MERLDPAAFRRAQRKLVQRRKEALCVKAGICPFCNTDLSVCESGRGEGDGGITIEYRKFCEECDRTYEME